MKKTFTLILFFSSIIYANIFAQNVLNDIDSKMVEISGGLFSMGADGFEKNENPIHETYLSGFYISKTEVTQAEYYAVMGENFSRYIGKNLPVEEVSWYDAIVFCNRLSLLKNLEPVYSMDKKTNPDEWGSVPRLDDDIELKSQWNKIVWNQNANGYRLPTEAEWEYAAKIDSDSKNDLEKFAWSKNNSMEKTHPSGQKNSNGFGLYDMEGNVWEWCWDWYTRYNKKNEINPLGGHEENSGRKVRRGGSFKSDAIYCRSTNRASSEPDVRGRDLGFRIARSVEKPKINISENLLTCIKNLPLNLFYNLDYLEIADFEKLVAAEKNLDDFMLDDFFGEQINQIHSGVFAEFSNEKTNKNLIMIVAKSEEKYFENKSKTFAKDFMDGVYEAGNFSVTSQGITYSTVQPYGQFVLCGTNFDESIYILIYAFGFDKKSLKDFMAQCKTDLTLVDLESTKKVFEDFDLEKDLLKMSMEKTEENQWNVYADFE